MAGMGCSVCRNIMRDHDGSIVYNVYTKIELIDYINTNLNKENPELLDIIYYGESILQNDYFWKCNKCQTVYLWDGKTGKCIGEYLKVDDFSVDIDLKNIEKLDEIFIINSNDNTDDLLIKDLFNKNPFRPFKYYVNKDLETVYIINTDKNSLDRIYKLIK